MSTNAIKKLRTSNGFGKMRRSWMLRGSIATLFFLSLGNAVATQNISCEKWTQTLTICWCSCPALGNWGSCYRPAICGTDQVIRGWSRCSKLLGNKRCRPCYPFEILSAIITKPNGCLRETKVWNADHPVPRVSQQQHTRQPDIASRLHHEPAMQKFPRAPVIQSAGHCSTKWGPALWIWTIRKVVRHALACWKCCLGPSIVWVFQL